MQMFSGYIAIPFFDAQSSMHGSRAFRDVSRPDELTGPAFAGKHSSKP
jgi:hypothetical protein